MFNVLPRNTYQLRIYIDAGDGSSAEISSNAKGNVTDVATYVQDVFLFEQVSVMREHTQPVVHFVVKVSVTIIPEKKLDSQNNETKNEFCHFENWWT